MTDTSFAGVRIARPEDADAVFALLLELNAENALMPKDDAKVHDIIARAVAGESGIIGVIDGPEGLEATIGLQFGQAWYSARWFLNEIWIEVHPEHRRSTHAKRLVEFAKWCADRLALPLILSVVTKDRLLPKLRLFQRQMPQVGALFAHGLEATDTFSQRRAADLPALKPARGSIPAVSRAEN